MKLKDRIKLSLDTTILQSNTAIDLINYIKRQRDMICKLRDAYEIDNKKAKVIKSSEYDIAAEAFERVLKEHVVALHRRLGRTIFEKSFIDEDEPEYYEKSESNG